MCAFPGKSRRMLYGGKDKMPRDARLMMDVIFGQDLRHPERCRYGRGSLRPGSIV